MGHRRTEEGHDPVAHHLVDRALITVDGLHHPFEHRVEELARLLGVAVGQQLHRSLQVGKQDGDLLALAFESCFGRQNALRKMLGRVGLGCGEPRCSRRLDQLATALSAELVRGRVGRVAC